MIRKISTKEQRSNIAFITNSFDAVGKKSMQELNNTLKWSSSTLHFNILLTLKAYNKSFGVEDDDPRVSSTE